MMRQAFNSREDWLLARHGWIGCSEAAACAGLSPFLTNTELYLLKTGNQTKVKDLSENEAVQTGIKEEPIIRALFEAEHPEYTVEYHATDVLWQKERPWLRGTLDGELTENETGKNGILEIKCVSVASKQAWANWDGKIPQHYYCQVVAQLACTGYDFAVVCARMKRRDGDLLINCYRFEKNELLSDTKWLLQKVDEFWKEYVEKRRMPAVILPEM